MSDSAFVLMLVDIAFATLPFFLELWPFAVVFEGVALVAVGAYLGFSAPPDGSEATGASSAGNCPSCGSPLSSDADACDYCGEPV